VHNLVKPCVSKKGLSEIIATAFPSRNWRNSATSVLSRRLGQATRTRSPSLKGEEDPDPGKAGEYGRCRELRKQQEENQKMEKEQKAAPVAQRVN
jgi:hypothetical protein